MSEDKGVMWTLNVFDGDPPEPHQHWHEWLEASQKSGVYTGVAIRSVAHHYGLSMLAESQAAESERLKEDAERYRFWRLHCKGKFVLVLGTRPAHLRFDPTHAPVELLPNMPEQCDAAIDAAKGKS